MKITPVILSGGSGTRLWPVSRELNPKQFLDFFGEYSLFQQTALRVKSEDFQNPIVVCNNEHRFTAAEELQKIGFEAQSIILEPCARNTAPAIAVAALGVMANDKENDVILVMPSDHIIRDEKKFIAQVKNSFAAAKNGYLITFGVNPDKAETGYGYIKKSTKAEDFSEVFLVEKFIEKPDQETAEKFLADGNYLWNSGIFMFRSSAYLEALQKYHNQTFISCINAHSKARRDMDFTRLSAEDFEQCTNISIDYAVMERAQKVAVVPVNIGWSDVGSWSAVAELSAQDADGNTLVGDSFSLNSKNCYINSRKGLVATIGVENLIVIALKDVTLVLNKNNAQDVKKIFEMLKSKKREECFSHTKVLRPWGSFEVMDDSDRFKVKRITVKTGASLSLQMHNHRAEHWIVVKGTAHVTCDKDEFILTEDKSTYIPIGKKHRLENKGKIPLELIEVQTGEYLGEDDIVRFSDIYGR
ncbi:MAG: mannose-1-phosphate guanylyltransferase/mannose-6-phosphate isomerase [Proteobacteria bacterium]|nr:mannose-1-phosphate guanylyltransferase/mannose-6-phosphate isomerase [Pseudomonadota bacterium]